MNTLLIEILACLAATALFSLFIGWMIRNSKAKRELSAVKASWESKQSELELRYKQDTEHLEDQLVELNRESQQLANRNDSISESLRDNEISVHKARADAIELNRQQAETQERLQRIIAQKDEELKRFRDNAAKAAGGGALAAGAVGIASLSADDAEAKMATLSAKRQAWEEERQRLINSMGDDQATIAIDPADLPSEPFDQTVRIDTDQRNDLDSIKSSRTQSADIETDRTMTLEDDHTLLLDESSLPKRPKNTEPNPGGTPDDEL